MTRVDEAIAHAVTVIVPVYGDLPTLVPCVESLLANVDQSVHRVLLVNDCGPQADEIEKTLLALIDGQSGFAYARNEKNLGFVGTCNRAALELDTTDNDILLLNSDTITTPGFLEELSAVLHLSPQHGAVCPRSNNATIASLPFQLRDPSVGRTMERTAAVHAALRDELPRFSVAPVAMGFCLLIRRDLILRYGLFDEAFAPGYGEENDFCLRTREHGFESLIAHRALVFHVGGRSFIGGRREALRSAHEKLIVKRYPFYTKAVRSYIHVERDPADVFADALVPGDAEVRVLIDIAQPSNTRLDDWATNLLVTATAARGRARFTVSAPDHLVTSLSRRFRDFDVVRQLQVDGQWDVALGYARERSFTQLARLNRTSLRWVLVSIGGTEFAGFEDASVDVLTRSPDQVLQDLVDRWGRSPVDLERLRSRWTSLTRNPEYFSGASAPREVWRTRVLRRAELLAPQSVGRVKGLARHVLRRN